MYDLLSAAQHLQVVTQNTSAAELATQADDLLLFLQRLNDAFIVYPSKKPGGTAWNPSILLGWISRLEASPDRTCDDDTFRSDVARFLTELCDGSVPVRPRIEPKKPVS